MSSPSADYFKTDDWLLCHPVSFSDLEIDDDKIQYNPVSFSDLEINDDKIQYNPVSYPEIDGKSQIAFSRFPQTRPVVIRTLEDFRKALSDADDKNMPKQVSVYFDTEATKISKDLLAFKVALFGTPYKIEFISLPDSEAVLLIAIKALTAAVRLAEWTLLRLMVQCECAINAVSAETDAELQFIDLNIRNIVIECNKKNASFNPL